MQGIEGMMKKAVIITIDFVDWIHGKRTIVERLLDDIFDSIVLRLKSFERIAVVITQEYAALVCS